MSLSYPYILFEIHIFINASSPISQPIIFKNTLSPKKSLFTFNSFLGYYLIAEKENYLYRMKKEYVKKLKKI